jgi:hypothetical protein
MSVNYCKTCSRNLHLKMLPCRGLDPIYVCMILFVVITVTNKKFHSEIRRITSGNICYYADKICYHPIQFPKH